MKEINEVRKLQNEGKLKEALLALQELISINSNDAIINYELGSTLDMSDRSEEAIPYYTKALELGLPKDLEKECMLGLGSSLSWKGKHQESIEILRKAVEKYPEPLNLQLFYGISLYRAQDYKESSIIFLKLLSQCNDQELIKFRRAIKNYLEEV